MDITLERWVEEQLQQHPDILCNTSLELVPLAGDAGFRQYYRVNTQPPLMAVAAPKTQGLSECADYFAGLSECLRDNGVPTPQIVACDKEHNFLLIEDFGPQSYLDVLNTETADTLYGQALLVLLRLQQIPRSVVSVPDYDQELLHKEMSLFDEWFVEKMLGHSLTVDERELLDTTYRFLVQKAVEQPQVLVHRDYHSRNLMYREGEAPGVIDFQDAVWGPITYDVVSLLRDCYIQWSPEQVKRWLMTYGNLAVELGLLDAVNEDCWQQWFDTMGLQRHIKVLGIFARLSLRDNKQRYLDDLPLVWSYTLDVAAQYPETQDFARWCRQTLLPLVQEQSWYSSCVEESA